MYNARETPYHTGKQVKTIRGQKLRESDYADVERQLKDLFYRLLFKPVVDLLAPHNKQVKAAGASIKKELRNAAFDPIVAGINSGRIQYVADVFTGEFNAAISRALRSYGAKFNRQTKAYSVLPQQLPVEVLEAAAAYAKAAKDLHDALGAKLDEIQRGLGKAVYDNPVDASKMVGKMDKSFDEHYGDALGTEGLSESSKARLAREYADALKPYVKDFTDEMVGELRAMVKANAEAGYRFDTLVDRIQGRFGVSLSKASFLARQETSMFVSKHRERRFEDSGITEYVWQSAGDSRVRPDHKKLDGKVFKYSQPPVVDEATGRRGNPGTDFQCRCVANPVLPRILTNA